MNVCFAVAFVLGANMYQDTFSKANAAYEAGDYAEAARLYEQLVGSSVVDSVVFYNLGNAYHRQGRLAYAIANYERALRQEPGFSAAHKNLGLALDKTERSLDRPAERSWTQSLLSWNASMTLGEARVVAIAAWLLFWAALAVRQWRPVPYTRAAAAAALVVAALFAGSAWQKSHPVPLAVAAGEGVPVRFGTSENEKVRYELHEGDRVTVERHRSEWVRVRTAGGERGWAQARHFVFAGPQYEPPAAREEKQTE